MSICLHYMQNFVSKVAVVRIALVRLGIVVYFTSIVVIVVYAVS